MYIPCQWRDGEQKGRQGDRTNSKPLNQEEQEVTGHKMVLRRPRGRCESEEQNIEMKGEGNKDNQ